jgi:hypothetical protein
MIPIPRNPINAMAKLITAAANRDQAPALNPTIRTCGSVEGSSGCNNWKFRETPVDMDVVTAVPRDAPILRSRLTKVE